MSIWTDKMEINLTDDIFTDYLLTDVGAAAFQLEHDWFIKQDLVIRDAAAGGGNLLVEGVDYTLVNESLDTYGKIGLSARVIDAVGMGRNVYSHIAIINAAYQTGDLYFSGKYVADSNAADDVNTLFNDYRPLGHLFGLGISPNAGDPNNDLDIAVGEAVDNADGRRMILSAAITKQLDAAWAVGTNAGGLDTGAKAANKDYAIWLIKRSDTGVVDVLFSLSATAPTMPAGYDIKRRIGWRHTDASSNWLPITQAGDYNFYRTVIVDRPIAALGATTRLAVPVSAPPGTIAILIVETQWPAGSAAHYYWIADADYVDAAASATHFTHKMYLQNDRISPEMHILVDALGQVYHRGESGTIEAAIVCRGYYDRRGRDG